MDHPPTIEPDRLSRQIVVETPEQVRLAFSLAGIGSRALAALIDGLLLTLLSLALFIVLAFISGWLGSTWLMAVGILLEFTLIWGYFALFEGLGGGRTPGKRRAGLRVMLDTGHPITFQAAVIRNLIRLVDLQPGASGLVGLLLVFFNGQGKRLGDMVAGTVVVRDEPLELGDVGAVRAEEPSAERPQLAAAARLTDAEFRLLDQFVRRADDLPVEARRRFRDQLVTRIADRFPEVHAGHPRFLADVHQREEAARRAPGAAAAPAQGAARRLRVGERFAALRQSRWGEFRERAAELERTGLSGLDGPGLLAFARDYRAMAADLARAHTYHVDPRIIARLERMVGVGHSALYGMRRTAPPRTRWFVLTDLPAAVVRRRRFVFAAMLLFLLPGVAGFALVRERPALAREILPDVMLDRAAGGKQQAGEGVGYAEAPSPLLPLVASSIISNNVQVAFGAFAFGVTAGVGTVLLLVFNGLSFGTALGHYANEGLAGWLLTFVSGHGVLELTAIFIAGGAGLLVARAIVAPGDLARRDAMVLWGREAIRMVGAAAALLLLAGAIEGLLSASGADPMWKFGVSGASAVLLALLWVAGARALRREAAGVQPATSSPVPYMTSMPATNPPAVSGVQRVPPATSRVTPR